VFRLEEGIKELKGLNKELQKAGNDQYRHWMNKAASQNLVLPIQKHEIKNFESVPLSKYLGFLEDIVDQACKFKEEKLYRMELERIRQMEEDGEHYESKIIRGRTRLNAHPTDVKRDLESQKNSKEDLLNTASKDESSMAFKKTALASGELTAEDSMDVDQLDNAVNTSHDVLGHTPGGVTLPSIFNNKKFEKDLPHLELDYKEGDFLRSNANILDLKKFKKRNLNIFNKRSNSYHFNNSYSGGFAKLGRSKISRAGVGVNPTTPASKASSKSNRKNLLNKTLRSNRGRTGTRKVSKAAILNQTMMER
jgi:hypothetical protein